MRALGGGIFAGLFTVGIKRAGFDVTGHVEQDNYGVRTCVENHPDLLGGVHYPKERWPTRVGKIDLMFCNPACAAWSAAGTGNKGLAAWKNDPRISQTTDLVRYGLEVVKPTVYVTESVTNAWRHGREFFVGIAQQFANAGYAVTIVLQNNAHLGAPQWRPRMLLFAHRVPLFTEGYGLRDTRDVPTCGAVLKTVKLTKRDKASLMLNERYLPLWEGSIAHKGMLRKTWELMEESERAKVIAPVAIMRRLRANVIAPVIYGYRKHMHPTEPRWLHLQEYLALFGLDDWKTTSSTSAATMELGRSVLPDVGAWVGARVAEALKRPPLKMSQRTYRAIDIRDPSSVITENLW